MNSLSDNLHIWLFGFLAGMVVLMIIIVVATAYLYKRDKEREKQNNPWKFKAQKPHTDLEYEIFTWEGPYRAYIDFKDGQQKPYRCSFAVYFFYEAECTEENIEAILAFEKEHKVNNSKDSDAIVGKRVWSLIKKRVEDAASKDFFKDDERFGELAIQEQINPFDQLAPNLKLKVSKHSLISISYLIAKVV